MTKKDKVPTVIVFKNPKPIAENLPSYLPKKVEVIPLSVEQRVAVIKQVRHSVYGDVIPAGLPLDPPAVVELTPDAPRSGNNWYNVIGLNAPANNYAGNGRRTEFWPESWGLKFHFETVPGKTYLVDLCVFGYVEKWIFSGAAEVTIAASDPNVFPYYDHLLVAFTANSFESELRMQYDFYMGSDRSTPAAFYSCVLTCVDL